MPPHVEARRSPWMRLPEFREALSSSVMALEVACDEETAFHASIDEASRDATIIASISATTHRATRTEHLIQEAPNQFVKLSLLLSGSAVLAQDGRNAQLSPGDLVLYDSGRPYTLLFTQPSRCLVVALPEREIGAPIEAVRRLSAIRLTAADGLAPLVVPFLIGISDNFSQLRGTSGGRLVQATASLVSSLVLDELSRDRESADRQQATFEAICAYARARLDDVGLTPHSIAEGTFVSVRTLYSTFSQRGLTVAGWIREQRLQRCREALLNPADHRTVSEIAARSGYLDAPGFSRAYRARFGEAPRETRASTRAPIPA